MSEAISDRRRRVPPDASPFSLITLDAETVDVDGENSDVTDVSKSNTVDEAEDVDTSSGVAAGSLGRGVSPSVQLLLPGGGESEAL